MTESMTFLPEKEKKHFIEDLIFENSKKKNLIFLNDKKLLKLCFKKVSYY